MITLPHPDGGRPLPSPLRLTEAEAERLRDIAFDRYFHTPHANPRVGRERYRAAIEAINALAANDEGEV